MSSDAAQKDQSWATAPPPTHTVIQQTPRPGQRLEAQVRGRAVWVPAGRGRCLLKGRQVDLGSRLTFQV